jgi:hypothetical protein
MKTHIQKLVLLLFFFISALQAFCQPADDIDCEENIFYAVVSNGINRIYMNSNSVVDSGVFISSTYSTLLSVAFGNDLLSGSGNRTIYSSTQSGLNPCIILRWTGLSWDTITTDTVTYHNAGAYGNFIYFQHSNPNGHVPNDQCISRLNSNGTLTKIYTDTTLSFTVADIAVDSLGNIYCFRGPSIGNTQEITKLSPNGTVINSFSTTLNNLSTIYGAMFFHDTLFLGWGTTNGQIFPVNFTGSSASLGSPKSVPQNFSMKDLASCYLKEGETTGLKTINERKIVLFPNPASNVIHIEGGDDNFNVELLNLYGSLILKTKQGTIDVSAFSTGVYFAKIYTADSIFTESFLIQSAE